MRVSLDARHRYSVDGSLIWRNGLRWRSVTGILRVLDKPGLDNWRMKVQVEGTARMAHERPPIPGEQADAYVARIIAATAQRYEADRLSKEAADLGTQCHALVEYKIRRAMGEAPERPDVSEEAVFVCSGYDDWATRADFKPMAVECRVAHRDLGYAGTLDHISLGVIAGEPAIIDLKTSKAVYAEHHLQLAGYALAIEQLGWPTLKGYVLRLPKDGAPIPDPMLTTADAEDTRAAFLSCLRLERWLRAREAA